MSMLAVVLLMGLAPTPAVHVDCHIPEPVVFKTGRQYREWHAAHPNFRPSSRPADLLLLPGATP
jgi:hypothetical protein